jgi:hypothetical protein
MRYVVVVNKRTLSRENNQTTRSVRCKAFIRSRVSQNRGVLHQDQNYPFYGVGVNTVLEIMVHTLICGISCVILLVDLYL